MWLLLATCVHLDSHFKSPIPKETQHLSCIPFSPFPLIGNIILPGHKNKGWGWIFFLFFFIFFFGHYCFLTLPLISPLFFCLLELQVWHMEVPRLGMELEPQLLAYATATATWDLSHVCELYHSSQQCWITDPRSETRDGTCILMATTQNRFCWATTGTPSSNFFFHFPCVILF